jgi:hypothetical protein
MRDRHGPKDQVFQGKINEELIVEIKVSEGIYNEHMGQFINYLRISGCSLGLILNFKHPKLEWKRVIYTEGEVSQVKYLCSLASICG